MTPVKHANPDFPIHPLLAGRWSPYGYADRPVSEDDLRSLFEAARWAASAMNEQPWRFIVATRGEPEGFEQMLSCLVESNREWAAHVPVLVLTAAKKTFARNKADNVTAWHDLGLAAASLTFEATSRGLAVHQMRGIRPEQARAVYAIPDDFDVVTAIAIGYAAPSEDLPERLRDRDVQPRQRRPLAELVFGNQWGTSVRFV